MNLHRRVAANRDRRGRPEGSEAAGRRDAQLQGTTAPLLDPAEEARAIEERMEGWCSSIRPWDAWELWLLRMLATETIRLERLVVEERLLGDHMKRRAVTMWETDRGLAALDLAARLPRDPERIAAKLRATSQGCDWVIRRWGDLLDVLAARGPWDERRRGLALDLLGIPADLRDADPLGLEAMPVEEQRALAEGQIAALEALKAESLDDRDADERAAAESGVFHHNVPRALASVRRARAECSRQIAWFRSQFRTARPNPSPIFDPPRDDRPAPDPIPDAEPAPPPPPPPPPTPPNSPAETFTEEEIRRREQLLAVMARRAEAERTVTAALATAEAAPPVLPVTLVPHPSAPPASRPSRRDRKARARKRRRR